jgi:hypothetical protein
MIFVFFIINYCAFLDLPVFYHLTYFLVIGNFTFSHHPFKECYVSLHKVRSLYYNLVHF